VEGLEPRLFIHPVQYLIIQIISWYLWWIQTQALIFSRLCFRQREGDTVDRVCCLVF